MYGDTYRNLQKYQISPNRKQPWKTFSVRIATKFSKQRRVYQYIYLGTNYAIKPTIW
jgi:hypothetical protein